MQYNLLLILSITGIIAFTTISVLNYRIWKRIQKEPELTLEYIFLKDSIRKAMEAFIASILIFLATSIITVIATLNQMILLSQAFRAGSIILFLGYLTYFYTLERNTRRKRRNRKRPLQLLHDPVHVKTGHHEDEP
jgi:hypothetical protein